MRWGCGQVQLALGARRGPWARPLQRPRARYWSALGQALYAAARAARHGVGLQGVPLALGGWVSGWVRLAAASVVRTGAASRCEVVRGAGLHSPVQTLVAAERREVQPELLAVRQLPPGRPTPAGVWNRVQQALLKL